MSIENNQDEELLKGLTASTAKSTPKEDDALDLGISESLGKLATRSNMFNKQRRGLRRHQDRFGIPRDDPCLVLR